jgi:hypothetical protein
VIRKGTKIVITDYYDMYNGLTGKVTNMPHESGLYKITMDSNSQMGSMLLYGHEIKRAIR